MKQEEIKNAKDASGATNVEKEQIKEIDEKENEFKDDWKDYSHDSYD